MFIRLASLASAFALVATLAVFPVQARGMTPTVTLDGVVESVTMCVSQEFPAITLGLAGGTSATVLTGPYYFLEDHDFRIRVGDHMTVEAFLSLWHENVYVAVALTNVTLGETMVLRDETGHPLWTAQGGPGSGGLGECHGGGAGPVDIVTTEGVVVAMNLGFSLQYPSITIARADGSKVTLVLGPYRYLVENGFEIAMGHRVRAEAFLTTWPDNTYAVVLLENLTTGVTLTLRTDDGKPLWVQYGGPGMPGGPGGPGGHGNGTSRMGDCSGWIPPEGGLMTIVTLEGVAVKVEMAPGQEFPTFDLALADSRLMTVVTGPYYMLLQAGFHISAGDRLRVRAFPSMWYEDTYVAVEIENLTTGETITLRDDSGHPLWTGAEQHGGRGIGFGGGAAWIDVPAGPMRVIQGPAENPGAGMGDGFSCLTVRKANGKRFTIVGGPQWYELQQRFEVRANQRVRVQAYPTWFDGVYVACTIKNKTTRDRLRLRDQDGRPLWSN